MTHFVTTLNSRRNYFVDLIPKNVRNSDVLSILYSRPLWEFRKPKFKIGGRLRISKYNLPFRKSYKPQFTQEVFKNVAVCSRKPPTYSTKDEHMRLSAVFFIGKSWSKSKNNGIVYNRVAVKCICTTISRQYTKLFCKLLTRQTESGRSMGGCNFRNIQLINVPKCCGGKNFVFFTNNFQGRQNFPTRKLVFTLSLRILLKSWTLSIKKDMITAKIASQLKCLIERKNLKFTSQEKRCGLAFLSTDSSYSFWSYLGNEFGIMLRGKGPNKLEFGYNIVRLQSLMINTNLIEYNIFGDTNVSLLRCFPFISDLKAGDFITTGQYMNCQTFRNLQFRPLLKKIFS